MSEIYLLNKPFNVLSQFTDKEGRATLADHIKTPGIYPAGRLDYDSEGLLLLTADGQLAHRIADPKHKLTKTYLVQVEGDIDAISVKKLASGVMLNDGMTKPAKVELSQQPEWLWPRTPPIRERLNQPTSWLQLTISEGRNRQVRRMTAAVGYPTLRLIRLKIGSWDISTLQPGEHRIELVHLPKSSKPHRHNTRDKNPAKTVASRRYQRRTKK